MISIFKSKHGYLSQVLPSLLIKMKLFLLIAGLTLVSARGIYEPINTNYHETIGIPLYERLKQAEAAQDFDGARIIGGQQSALGAFPYQVVVFPFFPNKKSTQSGFLNVSRPLFHRFHFEILTDVLSGGTERRNLSC